MRVTNSWLVTTGVPRHGDMSSRSESSLTTIPEHDDGDDTVLIRPDQYVMGNLGPGRVAILLDGTERLAEPVPARGQPGLWPLELAEAA